MVDYLVTGVCLNRTFNPAAWVRVWVGTIILWGSILALGLSEPSSLRGSTSVPVWLNIKAMTGCALIE